MSNSISPFHGDPPTWQHANKDGEVTFTVQPHVLTPVRAKIADFSAGLSVTALLAFGALSLTAADTATPIHFGAALIIPLLAHPLLKIIWRAALKKTSHVVFTPDLFKIETASGWKSYDRKLSHGFTRIEHDKTRAELEGHDYETRCAQARGEVIRNTRYYSESFHIALIFMGSRHDLITVFGRKESEAILARFITIDQIMDNHAHMGNGATLNPKNEWNNQPGEIS